MRCKTMFFGLVVPVLLCASASAAALTILGDGRITGSAPHPGGGTDPALQPGRTVSGQIIRARPRGNTGSSAVGGPRCADLSVSFYLQGLAATQGRFLASVPLVDTNVVAFNGSTACAYFFTTRQSFSGNAGFKRWFAVVNERGPIDYAGSCYQQAYADLGGFAANLDLRADINLVETCPAPVPGAGN